MNQIKMNLGMMQQRYVMKISKRRRGISAKIDQSILLR